MGGRGRKNIWGTQIHFSLEFGSEGQKKSSSQILTRGYGPFDSFRGTILAWGGGVGTLLAWRVKPNLMVRISVLAHKFRGEDQKKGFRREILGFVLAFIRVFRPGT